MGVLRSERMKHGTLVLPVDRARFFLDLIGSHAYMEFEDMNGRDMQRPYKKYIQRIDEMERILRFLFDELAKIPDGKVIVNNVDNFLDSADSYKLDEVEAELKQAHQDFLQFKENSARLIEKRNAALEARYVVQTALASMSLIHSARGRSFDSEDGECEFAVSRSLLDDHSGIAAAQAQGSVFSACAGVLPQSEQDRFARSLFRATRGNSFTHFQQIPGLMLDPKTGREVSKSVFVVHFADLRAGTSKSAMSDKVHRICNSFSVNIYPWPDSKQAAEQMMMSFKGQLDDQERLLSAHERFVRAEAATLLEPVRQHSNSRVEDWRLFCKKEKAIYATLNLFEGNMNLRANCWYPEKREPQIRALLVQHATAKDGHRHGAGSSAMLVSDRGVAKKGAPTYIHRNEFTAVFQELVDTYGLPRYQEANPALFTIVSFPFLFGIMYGDVGHGAMLLAVGLWAVWNADKLRFTVPALYLGRYILVMMGFFFGVCGVAI
jgi:V-type H+-transporting ATPase subunit a